MRQNEIPQLAPHTLYIAGSWLLGLGSLQPKWARIFISKNYNLEQIHNFNTFNFLSLSLSLRKSVCSAKKNYKLRIRFAANLKSEKVIKNHGLHAQNLVE